MTITTQRPRLAIIGASYLQMPLIEKAKERGFETHAFAWAANDVGEAAADVFHPISIIEVDKIIDVCRDLNIVGICSIASDVATLAVNHVANALGLPGNSLECTVKSTNKHAMREAFEQCGDPSPKSFLVDSETNLDVILENISWPIIVKPTDRSGSRGITKLYDTNGLEQALDEAYGQSFEHKALIEEFAEGEEFSVEYISQGGVHHFLAITRKFTTGAPHFIETGHEEPADLDEATYDRVKAVVEHALNSLGVTDSASHSEVMINSDGSIKLIEIGARMGGDFIGSDLVYLSTGYDYVDMVIDVACGNPLVFKPARKPHKASAHFIFNQEDVEKFETIKREHPETIWKAGDVDYSLLGNAHDSSTRAGWYVLIGEALDA